MIEEVFVLCQWCIGRMQGLDLFDDNVVDGFYVINLFEFRLNFGFFIEGI